MIHKAKCGIKKLLLLGLNQIYKVPRHWLGPRLYSQAYCYETGPAKAGHMTIYTATEIHFCLYMKDTLMHYPETPSI